MEKLKAFIGRYQLILFLLLNLSHNLGIMVFHRLDLEVVEDLHLCRNTGYVGIIGSAFGGDHWDSVHYCWERRNISWKKPWSAFGIGRVDRCHRIPEDQHDERKLLDYWK